MLNISSERRKNTEVVSYRYTSMGVQMLVPKKINILVFTLIFSITGCFFLLTLSKVYFQVRKYVFSNISYNQLSIQRFLEHTFTNTTRFPQETVTQLVALRQINDGHLIDNIPWGYMFAIFKNVNHLSLSKKTCCVGESMP